MSTPAQQATRTIEWNLDQCGDPVVVATHRRSGTHMMIDFVRRQFRPCQSWKWPGQNTNLLYLAMGAHARGMMRDDVARRVIHRPERPVLKTHSLPTFDLQRGKYDNFIDWVRERGRVLYVLRDCRAVMASLYAYMQRFDPKALVKPSEFLRQTDLLPEYMSPSHEGLSRPAQWAHHVSAWVQQNQALVMRYEDIMAKPRDMLELMGPYLGMTPLYREPLLPPKFSRSMWARVGRRLSPRPTSTAIISPRAPGVEHSWRKLFSPEDLEFIWQEAGDVMIDRGYTREG